MNVKLLRRIQKFILDEPRRFDMSSWTDQVRDLGAEQPPCGTTACIGGTAYWLSVKPSTFRRAAIGPDFIIEDRAKALLQLKDEEGERLFFSDGWPLKYRSAYNRARTSRGKARAAVRRIDHFIKTKGKE